MSFSRSGIASEVEYSIVKFLDTFFFLSAMALKLIPYVLRLLMLYLSELETYRAVLLLQTLVMRIMINPMCQKIVLQY